MEKIHHHVLQFVDGTRNLWRQDQVGCSEKCIAEPMLQQTWQEIEYRLDVLRVTKGAHIEMY